MNFHLEDNKTKIKVFTTIPDTLFGASFIAISVDHPITKNFENDGENGKQSINSRRFDIRPHAV